MKLQPDKSSAPLVRAYHSHWLQIDDQRFERSVVVSSLPGQPVRLWAPMGFEQLQAEHLQDLISSGAELVILGTGLRQKFPPAAWMAPFVSQRIGLEAMDTSAACRTYNILASEGRKVLAALVLEPARTISESDPQPARGGAVSR